MGMMPIIHDASFHRKNRKHGFKCTGRVPVKGDIDSRSVSALGKETPQVPPEMSASNSRKYQCSKLNDIPDISIHTAGSYVETEGRTEGQFVQG